MQLIDREQLQRIIDRYIDETGADTFTKDHLIDFLLDSEPVDAVVVVRCNDCRHNHCMIGDLYRYCDLHNMRVYADD